MINEVSKRLWAIESTWNSMSDIDREQEIDAVWAFLKAYFSKTHGVDLLVKNKRLLESFKEGYASTRWHGNFPGGLWHHSILVTLKAITFVPIFHNICTLDISDVVTAAILHDIGKLGLLDNSGRIIKPHYVAVKGDPDKITYNKSIMLSHAELSAHNYSILSGDKFSFDVHNAIFFHDGAYVDGFKRAVQGNETPLMLAIHWADMFVARILKI